MSGLTDSVSADPSLETTPAVQRLDFKTKLFYGFGSIAFGVKDNGFSYLLLLFYNQVVGLPAPLVGFALMIALIFDATIDPVIGHLSDNLRSKWGRRHPFMYAAALPVALTYAALWNPPHWDHQALFFYLLFMAISIRALISCYEVPSSALAAEFSTGYDERSVLLSYRYFFGWVGGLAINLLAFAVLLKPDKIHKLGQLNPVGYAHYGVVAAVVMFVAILISAAGTHSRIPTLRLPPAKRHLTLREVLGEMRDTLSNRSFVFLLFSTIASAMAVGLGASLNNYFNTFFWEFTARQISGFTAGVFLSAIFALIAAPIMSRRFGKRGTAMSLMMLSVAIGIGPLILRLLHRFPANHTELLYGVIFGVAVVGTGLGIVSSTMGSSMIADVVEASELKTGRRSEGLFFAASAFVGKAVSGFGIFFASLLIAAIHLNPGANPATVPPEVVRNLALIYCPVIILLYLAALALMNGYKITRASHQATLVQLAADAEEAVHPV